MFLTESIHLESFDLGNQTPFVKSIQIFDPPVSGLPQSQFSMSNPGSSPTRTTLVANVDIGLIAPDSKLALRARVGGKRYRVIYMYMYVYLCMGGCVYVGGCDLKAQRL